MDEGDVALAIASELNKAPWKADGLDIGEIMFMNEDGEKFRLSVQKVANFYGSDEDDLALFGELGDNADA